MPSFNGSSNGNPYDLINSLPSSYGSGKVSPLTPNDPVGGLHHSSAFPPSSGGNKDYPGPGYNDFGPDRRLANISSGSYQSDVSDDYAMGGVGSNSVPFNPPFQDRLARFAPDNRFGHSNGPPPLNTQLPHTHSPDIMRSVAPHATHSYRSDNGVPGYDDMNHYIGNNHGDLSALRLSSVDEQLARVGLRGSSSMGTSSDLQTFIR